MIKYVVLLLLLLPVSIYSKTVTVTSLEYKVAVSDVIVTGRLRWTTTTQLASGQLYEGDIVVDKWLTTKNISGQTVPIYYLHENELGAPPDFSRNIREPSIWLLSRGSNSLSTVKRLPDLGCGNSYGVASILPLQKLEDVQKELEKYKLCLRFAVCIVDGEPKYYLRIEQRNSGALPFPICMQRDTVGIRDQWKIDVCRLISSNEETSSVQVGKDAFATVEVPGDDSKCITPLNNYFEGNINKLLNLPNGPYVIKLVAFDGTSSNEVLVDIQR